MILSKEVEVILNSNNTKWYEDKGYFIPRVNKLKWKAVPKTPRGTKIKVKVEDLSPGSHVKILFKCEDCCTEKWIGYQSFRRNGFYKICHTCKMRTDKVRIQISKNHAYVSGKNNPLYNHNLTSEERFLGRNRNIFPGYYFWIKSIRSIGKCKICGSTKKLVCHHLNSWNTHKEERTNLNNGVCLCVDCHKAFHKLYGKNTTKEMFLEFTELHH